MKCSISNIAWKKENQNEIRSLLKSYELKYIDIAPLLVVKSLYNYKKIDVVDYIEFWNEYNINIAGMQSLFYEVREKLFFNSTDTALFFDYFYNIVMFAKQLNIKNLVLGCPKQRSFDKNKIKIETVVKFYQRLINVCKKNNVYLCLEPNAKEYNCNFLTNTLDTLKFIKTLNSKFVKMNFDTGTILMNNNDPISVYDTCKEHIGHMHLSSPYLQPVDEDTLDHERFSFHLKKSGYNKVLAIEMLTNHLDCIDQVEKSVKIIKKYYA